METGYTYETVSGNEEPDYYIALLPDEPECEIGILWYAISPDERERIQQRNTKPARRGRPEKTDWQAFAQAIAKRCVRSIKGLTPRGIRKYGILLLTDAGLQKAEADHEKRGWSETPFSETLLEQLMHESDKFRQQVIDFSTEVEMVDQARKVWLGKASRTGRSGAVSEAS